MASESYQQNIKKLMAGRLDLIAAPNIIIRFIIDTELPEYRGKLVALTPSLSSNKLFNIFSRKIKNSQELTNDFNQGLSLIKQDGTFARLAKKHNIDLGS